MSKRIPAIMGLENREGLNESQPGRISKLLLDEHPHIRAGYYHDFACGGDENPVRRGVCGDSRGAYVVNAKTAPADAAVDDEVTLW